MDIITTSNTPMPMIKDRVFASPDTPLAMAYVPWQFWDKTYEPEVGFSRGTIFPRLDKPFVGEEAVPNG